MATSARHRFAAFEHEFLFVFDELGKLETQVEALCAQWESEIAGSAPPPASWHKRQFLDAQEAFLQASALPSRLALIQFRSCFATCIFTSIALVFIPL